MATATVEICEICTNLYNFDRRQSVTLPCGHNFCLSCLVCLKACGKCQCPTCRSNWDTFDMPALPGMEAIAKALQADQDDEEDTEKKKGLFDRCEKHSMPYDYWVTGTTEFFCRRCAKENRNADIELIEDAIPQVKEALEAKIPNAMKKIECDLESLDDMHASFVFKRNCVLAFVKEAMALDDNFNRKIEQVAALRSQVLNTAVTVKKMQGKIHNIKNAAEINLVAECKFILERVVRPLTLPSSDLSQSLLFIIACNYVEEAATANPPARVSFINAMLKDSSVGPLTEDAWEATPSSKTSSSNQVPPTTINPQKPSPETVAVPEELKKGQPWTVGNNNCEAALLALADRHPSLLTLVVRDDAREALPVAAIARAVKGCEVRAIFVDTFYSADNTATDVVRLKNLTANKSLRLTRFFGHLNHSTIAKLPQTITELGLAIGNEKNAAAVSGLRPWEGLKLLSVSMSSCVPAKVLKKLPSVLFNDLCFPFLSDAGVDSVRPTIEALAPDLRIRALCFPKSQMTKTGAHLLTTRLRGVTIPTGVRIEAGGSWQPGAGEKKIVEDKLRSATRCSWVAWDMDWIYG